MQTHGPKKDKEEGDPLSTDHLMTNLTDRTVYSGIISLATQGGKFVLTITSTIVLARLLSPEDFGLVAMVVAVSGFFMMLKDAGLSTATIQKKDITHEQVSNLFWINLAFSAGLSLLMLAFAYPIAWFYDNSKLIEIGIALSAIFIIGGSSFQHQALLKRQMKFQAIAIIEIGSISIGFTIAVLLAMNGARHWALVFQQISIALSACLLTWMISNWKPSRFKRNSNTRPLINFGVNLSGASLLQALSRIVEYFLIGRFYGAAVLGLYSRANALLMNPVQQLMGPLSSVFVPVLSRLQDDEERYHRYFFKIYEFMAIFSIPFSGICFVLSKPIVMLFLGEKWIDAAPIFRCFTIFTIYAPLAGASIWLFMSQGRGKDLVKLNLVTSTIAAISIIIGAPFGATGVAFSYSITGLLIRLPVLYASAGKCGPVGTSDLIIKFVMHLPLWFGAAISTYFSFNIIPLKNPIFQVAIPSFVGFCVSTILVFCVRYERKAVLETLETLKKTYKKTT